MRPVGAHIQIIGQSDAACANWIAEGGHVTLSRAAFGGRTSLAPKRAAALTVFPQDLLMDVAPASEECIRRDLAKAVVRLLDGGFLDPNNDGTIGPASVTYGVSPLASASDLKTDVTAALDAFRATWILRSGSLRPAWLRRSAYLGAAPSNST